MNVDFANAMRSAMNLISDQKLAEATRVIQSALSGVEPVFESPSRAQVVPGAIQHKVIDLTAEVIEPETIASAEVKTDTDLIGRSRQESQIGMPDRWARLSGSSATPKFHLSVSMD
jgi:hypothetical protein